MEAVQKYLFWIIIGAVILVALAVQMLVIGPIQAEAQMTKENCASGLMGLKKVAKDPSGIRNARYVEAAKKYKGHLESQERTVQALWENKRLKLSDTFKNAPSQNITFFDVWLPDVRKKILETAAKSNLQLPNGSHPDGFPKSHLYGSESQVPEGKRMEWVNKLALINEVVSSLAGVKAQVSRYEWEPDLTKSNDDKKLISVGVQSLDALEILDNEKQAERRKKELEAPWKAAKNTLPQDKNEKETLYEARRLEIIFTAPLSVVAPALKALESNPNYFGVIRTIDSQRCAAPYPDTGAFGQMVPKDENYNPGRLNSYYQEAPIQVLVIMDLLDFENEKVEKALKKAPPPPSRRSKSSRRSKKKK